MGTGPRFDIEAERETDSGWSYSVRRTSGAAASSTHLFSLSWPDHDLISGGTAAPSATIGAVCSLLAEHPALAARLPARVDVSTLRRAIPDFDSEVQRRIAPSDPLGG